MRNELSKRNYNFFLSHSFAYLHTSSRPTTWLSELVYVFQLHLSIRN